MAATTSTPERRSVGAARARAGRRRSRWLMFGGGVLLAAAGITTWLLSTRSAAPAVTTASVSRGDLQITVTGSGTVQPARSLSLAFQVGGRITEVLVNPGDRVTAGQPLARLDSAELELQLQQAQAALTSAEARLAETRGEGATALEIEQAKLAVQTAEIQLRTTTGGDATAADLRSAQASLQSAQARLRALTQPTPSEISAAETRLAQAQAALQNTRDSDSASKTRAELDLQQTVNALTQAQARYATAQHNWEYARETGNDPIQPDKSSSNGERVPNKLTDGQLQQYYDSYVQAEAALRSAEAAVKQAQLSYDSARQKEAIDVAQAEQSVRDAQVQLDALRNPSQSDLVQAQAAVTQAQAQLDKLRMGGTTADIELSQIQLRQAQIALERLTAPASATEIAGAEAAVAQARTQLVSAQLDLEHATLSAPFDGLVTDVDAVVGANVGTGAAVVAMIDPSKLHIDINLSEADSNRVALGQPVTLTFDSLPGVPFTGTVEYVASTATVQQNVVTYLVRVGLEPGGSALKVGMSATGAILVDERRDAVLAPSRAIQTQNGQQYVTVRTAPGQPAVVVEVTTGLSSGGRTEILSCVATGTLCLREGDLLEIPAANTSQRTTTQSPFFGGGVRFNPGGGGR